MHACFFVCCAFVEGGGAAACPRERCFFLLFFPSYFFHFGFPLWFEDRNHLEAKELSYTTSWLLHRLSPTCPGREWGLGSVSAVLMEGERCVRVLDKGGV